MLHTVSLGRITVVDDSDVVQKLQVSERPGPDGSISVSDNVYRVAQFGFGSSPPLQSDAVLARLWGNRTLTIAIGTNHQPSRVKNLKPGETVVYDVLGQKVYLSAAGIIIDGAGLPLSIRNVAGVINAPTAVLNCLDAVTASGVSLAGHVHPLSGPGAPETGAPLPE